MTAQSRRFHVVGGGGGGGDNEKTAGRVCEGSDHVDPRRILAVAEANEGARAAAVGDRRREENGRAKFRPDLPPSPSPARANHPRPVLFPHCLPRVHSRVLRPPRPPRTRNVARQTFQITSDLLLFDTYWYAAAAARKQRPVYYTSRVHGSSRESIYPSKYRPR